jgi:hypothetical protein
MDAPDTVTEAVALLEAAGYTDDLSLVGGELRCDTTAGRRPHPVATAVADHIFRFEGPTDPADEAIVVGISCPEWGTKGVLVAAFGPEIEPEDADALRLLIHRS